MGCVTKKSLNGWNFITANLANNVTVSDLASTVSYCSLTLDAPSSLIATASSSSQIDLSWVSNNNGSESGFGIERSIDGIVYVQIDTVGTGISIYSDTGLTDGTKYYYQVRALGIIPSANSNIAYAITLLDFGLALDFGASSKLTVSNAINGVAMDDSQTIAFWYRNSAPQSGDRLLFTTRNTSGGASQENMTLSIEGSDNTGTWRYRIKLTYLNANNGVLETRFIRTNSNTDLFDGNWHRVVISREKIDVTTSRHYLFVDGQKQGASGGFDNYKDLLVVDLTANFQLYTWFGNSATCQIDEFIIFNGTVSEQESSDDYNAGNGSKYFESNYPMVLYKKFNKVGAIADGDNTGLSDVVVDSSGNGYDSDMNGTFSKNGSTENWVDSVN